MRDKSIKCLARFSTLNPDVFVLMRGFALLRARAQVTAAGGGTRSLYTAAKTGRGGTCRRYARAWIKLAGRGVCRYS
jgi:hypothetical protein